MANKTTSQNLTANEEQESILLLDVNRIQIGDDRRPVNETMTADLAESIALTGQISPIVVRPLSGDSEHDWELLAGRQRLHARTRAGYTTVVARVLSVDDEHAQLVEVDENLFRQDLSPAEKAIALQKRKAIHDRLHDDKARAAHIANMKLGRMHDASAILSPAFAAHVAERTGSSIRSVERSLARAAAIGADQLKSLVYTCPFRKFHPT